MRILLVTIAYPPEIRSISTMMRELAEELTHRGHRVTVLTSSPYYNRAVAEKNLKFKTEEWEEGARVIRVSTLPHHKVGYVIRGIAQVMLPFFFRRAIKKFIKERVDAVIVYSPHLPLTRVGNFVKRRDGARYLLNIQDIFPQNAIDLGILRNRLLIWFFERMEREAYGEADVITTHTIGGREFLIARKGVPPEKITVVENWIDTAPYRQAHASGLFRKRYGLERKFILLFPGILGPAQQLDFLIDVASRVRDIADLVFLFVGDGTEKARLQQTVVAKCLQNVYFYPFVSLEEYPMLVKEADVGILCLGMQNTTAAVPGKLLGFMAAGLPALAFLNRESDGHRIIAAARCGWTQYSDNPERAAVAIRTLYNDRASLAMYGANGQRYAEEHFSKAARIDQLEELLYSPEKRS